MDGKADQSSLIPKFCEICKKVKTEEVICQLHREKDNIPANCSACIEFKSE